MVRKSFDALTVDMLVENGADLSLPHDINFNVDFTSERSAYRMADHLRAEGYRARVLVSDDGSEFRCKATRRLIPQVSELERLSEEFTAMAGEYDGEYDGWGSEVET